MRFASLPFFVLLIITGSAFAQTAPVPPGTAPSAATIRGTYGDWQMRCEITPPATSEQCALVQSVSAKDRPNVGLMVIAFKTADQKAQILRVIAPLGVLLPSGLRLRIDEEDIGATDFVRCVPNGCIAEAKLNDDLIKKLKTGKTANFVIFQTPEEGIGVPVSLNGFATGYDLLK